VCVHRHGMPSGRLAAFAPQSALYQAAPEVEIPPSETRTSSVAVVNEPVMNEGRQVVGCAVRPHMLCDGRRVAVA
jgi:hypothetical protein